VPSGPYAGYVFTSMAWPAGGTAIVAVGYPVSNYAGQQAIYKSTDNGASWAMVQSGIWSTVQASSDGGTLYAGGSGSEGFSTDSGTTWTVHYSDNYFGSLGASADGSTLFAGTNFYGGAASALISTDSGQHWTNLLTGTLGFNGVIVSADGNTVTGSTSGGTFFSASAVTTAGINGSLSGTQSESVTLQYFGQGQLQVVENTGQLTVQ
jgi:hypothetical protein